MSGNTDINSSLNGDSVAPKQNNITVSSAR